MKEYKRKVVMLGDAAVGKTSLVRRFVQDRFDDKYITTIGTKVMKKDVILKDQDTKVTLMVWDILGQKNYSKIQTSSFKGTQGAILVLDRTRPKTKDSIKEYWIPKLKQVAPTVPIVVAGNKSDLLEEVELGEGVLKNFAKDLQAPLALTSAKTGQGVEEMFKDMAKLCMWKLPMPSISEEDVVIETLVHACDAIIDDFCKVYGDMDDAMPFVRKQVLDAKVDLNAPSEDNLKKLVENFYEVEKSFHSEEKALENKKRRMKFIRQAHDD